MMTLIKIKTLLCSCKVSQTKTENILWLYKILTQFITHKQRYVNICTPLNQYWLTDKLFNKSKYPYLALSNKGSN